MSASVAIDPKFEDAVYPAPRPIAVDLFSGAGGMSLGFEQAGFDIAFAVDRDGHHSATHARNFPYGVSMCASVSDLSGKQIRQTARLHAEIDLVFGGPPCQGFSSMGIRDQHDPRNTLPDQFVRIVGELMPKAFVMENVPGMQSGKTASIFERILESFERLGYRITHPVQCLNAADFGVPQNRSRLFILGLRNDLGKVISYPSGPCPGQPARPTIEQALVGLPTIEDFDELFKSDLAPYPEEPSKDAHYARVARGLERDPSDASRPRIWNASACSGSMRVLHRKDIQELYAATSPGQMVPGHKLPKLNPGGIAPTLRAGSESERGSHTAPRPVHPYLPRCITAREAARLHGYPDWFSFYPAKWHAYRQIGNSVCPPVARAIGWQILQALEVPRQNTSPAPVQLRDQFELPENRPKQHQRIQQIVEFPKVINLLFQEAFDTATNQLITAEFTVEDIAKAIHRTQANMPRVTAERFLDDVARSRNLQKLLALPHQFGLTITKTATGGRFAPIGSGKSIEDKDAVKIHSQDLASNLELELPPEAFLSASPSKLFEALESNETILQILGTTELQFERDLFGVTDGKRAQFFVGSGKFKGKKGLAFAISGSSFPKKSQISKFFQDSTSDLGLVVARLTAEHVLAVIFIVKPHIVELGRETFRLTQALANYTHA